MGKLLSICIPTYNRAHTLQYTLESIYMQIESCNDEVEICVSNNCSSDNTNTVVEKYQSLFPIKYHIMEHTVNALCNWTYTLKCMATGEFTILLGDDDIIVNNGIQGMLEKIKTNYNMDYFYLNHTHRQLEEIIDIVQKNGCQCEIHQIECESYIMQDHVVDKWEKILNYDGKYRDINMLYIGNHLFRPKMWNYNLDNEEYITEPLSKATFEYYYMGWSYQVQVFATAMMGRECYYVGKPIIVQGLGYNYNVLDSNSEILLLTYIGRWEKLFLQLGIDPEVYKEYKNYMNTSIIKRFANVVANKREILEKNPWAKSYIYNNIQDDSFVETLFDCFSDTNNDYYTRIAKSNFEQQLSHIKSNITGHVVLWGTGDVAKSIIESSELIKDMITYVVDGNINKHDSIFTELNKTICSPQSLADIKPQVIIIATAKHEDSVVRFIRDKIKEEVITIGMKGIRTINLDDK